MRRSLRALRQRWGIAAPRLAVTTHVAWYWRALGIVAVLSVSLVLAMWMYDAGRRIAGFDATAAEGELATLRHRVTVLEDELKGVPVPPPARAGCRSRKPLRASSRSS